MQESSEITFSDEDMEVGYLDHRRPLYLAASINQIPIKRALVDTGAFVTHPIKHFTSGRNFRKKDSGVPNESDKVQRKGRIHRRPHPIVVKGGPYSFLSSVPRGKDRGLISCAFGEAMVAQTPISPVHLSPMRKGKIEW